MLEHPGGCAALSEFCTDPVIQKVCAASCAPPPAEEGARRLRAGALLARAVRTPMALPRKLQEGTTVVRGRRAWWRCRPWSRACSRCRTCSCSSGRRGS